VFLGLGLTVGHGTAAGPAILFAAIGLGDFADGATARITGQFSRLGALLDPATDRLLAISGAAVCWRWALLPRWALAVLLARELAMLVLGRLSLSRGIELRINTPGRVALALVLGALLLALAGLREPGAVLLYVGVALAVAATALYLHSGAAQLRRLRDRPSEGPLGRG
jgi:cardiolipin synthase